MAQIGYRGIYNKTSNKPFRVSRSKIELFTQCQRCFWLDCKLGIKRPDGPPFSINKTIDELFKKEFDVYREKQQPHPIQIEYKIDALPFMHERLDEWRETFVGVQFHDPKTNFVIFGGVDDVWHNSAGELIVVDYKATSKDRDVSIDAHWQKAYKRQMEVYQWLLRQNGFEVSNIGYFVYTNGRVDLDGFNNMLEFRTKLIPYEGNDNWIPDTLNHMKAVLENDGMPPVGKAAMGGACDFCGYAEARTRLTLEHIKKQQNKA